MLWPILLPYWRYVMQSFGLTRFPRQLATGSAIALCLVTGVAQADQPFLVPNSLIISSSTYDATQGAVAALTAGTTVLPNAVGSTTTAVSGNNYVTVWNNESVDPSFGVTSPIR